MKRTDYKTYIGRAFMALVVMGAMTGCVMDYGDCPEDMGGDGRLSVMGTVSDATVVTRTAAVADLKEKDLVTLDVFVEHVTGTTGDGTFQNQYHLTATTDKPIEENVNNWLADNWRAEGLKIGEKYNIYVATNNTQTKDTKDLSTFNVAALKALVADEVTDEVAIVNEGNNNVTWGETTTSGNIYKLYDANPGNYRALTDEKQFMMDGVLENWTPVANSRDQVFKTVTLNRAAAKIVLNVKFDATFLRSLEYDKDDDGNYTIQKPAAKKVSITGSPAWKFYNFAFGAPVFDPRAFDEDGATPTAITPVEVHNSDFNIFHNQSFTGNDKHFQIITYTYPNAWASANYASDSPSLVVSIPYTEGTGDAAVTNYGYYRIPLVKSTVTEIERNHIYVVNATISTRGSEIQEDQDLTEDIQYAVLPWNDQNNSDVIVNEVESVQHYYFNVNPKVYTLRGDGDQSVVLNYSKASGTKVSWKLFTYDENGNQTGVVEFDDPDAVWAWFYDADGDFTTTYSDNSGTDWSQMGVSIVQSTEGTSGSKGTVTVTSTALNNKGIKYIRLRVFLDEEETFDANGNETMYEDIIIRHFPTDNIQNIVGSWSSYHTADNSIQNVTLTTTILAEAESWAAEYGVPFTSEEINETEYINYATYNANASDTEHYHMTGPTAVTQSAFQAAVQGNTNRRNANSQANAIADAGEGHTYYWGTNPQQQNNNYDYYTGNNQWNRTYYKYQNYYSATYTRTSSYTKYSLTVQMASTGDWVDWDNRATHTPARTYSISYANQNNTFIAKVYNNGIYRITETGSNYAGWTTTYGNQETGLNNNHMYVIQISSTSDSYVLGRPYVNTNTHQSQDNVVSPAFMIASQLGAVTPFTGNNGPTNAATHCSRYMEVAADGTRYIGWRLPTEAEISVITGYQYGNIGGVTIPSEYQVLTPVLTGRYYHSLSGQEIEANPNAGQNSQTRSYLRCVRDLSAEEVDRLNGFDKSQEKYR